MEYNGPLLFGAPQVTGDFHWFPFFLLQINRDKWDRKKYATVVLFDQNILFVMPESEQVCDALNGHYSLKTRAANLRWIKQVVSGGSLIISSFLKPTLNRLVSQKISFCLTAY